MSDSLTKAQRFHALAGENLRHAEAATNASQRNHYHKLAEHYLILAEQELKAAGARNLNS